MKSFNFILALGLTIFSAYVIHYSYENLVVGIAGFKSITFKECFFLVFLFSALMSIVGSAPKKNEEKSDEDALYSLLYKFCVFLIIWGMAFILTFIK